MKILFLCEYFYPFAHGGAENSTYYLCRSLISKDQQVYVLTPNYDSKPRQLREKITIIRIPFFPKLIRGIGLSPFYFYNPLSQLLFFLYSVRTCLKENINIIHVQGSHLILPALLAARLLHKKFVVTIRNYQSLCPLSLCINRQRNYLACSWYYFLTREIGEYFNLYEKDSSGFKKTLLATNLILARFKSQFDRWLCKNLTNVLSISHKQQLILKHNGITSTLIYNTYLPKAFTAHRTHKDFLYIGRLTPGKGINLLLEAFIKFMEKHRTSHRLIIIGQGFLKSQLRRIVEKNRLSAKVIFLGQMEFTETITKLSSSLAVVIPSVWEEPFGRVALEAQMHQVPAIVTNRGGLPEIVLANKTGLVVEPTTGNLTKALEKMVNKHLSYRRNLKSIKKFFRYKFITNPLAAHLKLYRII